MIDTFLKEQNISLENIWVCHDLKGNVRTVDLEKLLEDYHKWKVKNFSSNTVFAAAPDTDMGHGKCKEKNCEKWATVDYNGHGHWVCKGHYESLSNYFDEEYR